MNHSETLGTPAAPASAGGLPATWLSTGALWRLATVLGVLVVLWLLVAWAVMLP